MVEWDERPRGREGRDCPGMTRLDFEAGGDNLSPSASSTINHWPSSIPSIRVGISDDAPEGLDAVLPADVLALLVGATVVGDRDLVHAALPLGQAVRGRHLEPRHLGRHLGLEPEPVTLQVDPLDHLAAED